MKRRVSFQLNGEERTVSVEPRRLLVETLRDGFGLTGTKLACGVGVCGVCTVLLDGLPVSSCLMLTVMADGRSLLTIEGVADDRGLHPLQRSFIEQGGFQCGICTPGQILSALALLRDDPAPSREVIRSSMAGNLCRCTGYYEIVTSIAAAAQRPPAADG